MARLKPGTAVLFDRRLWHSASPNWSDVTRKVLFYGYGYRWARVKDDMTVEDLWPKSDPIRRQLLGYAVKPMVVTRQRTMTSHCVSGCVNTAPADSL